MRGMRGAGQHFHTPDGILVLVVVKVTRVHGEPVVDKVFELVLFGPAGPSAETVLKRHHGQAVVCSTVCKVGALELAALIRAEDPPRIA